MIEVNNLTNTRVAAGFLKGLAKKTLKSENREELELSVALVGRARIRDLNKKYRKKDRPTDVLSFRYGDDGEVIICPKEVRKNALKYRSTFKKELARVLIHGIWHILGYTHKAMSQKQIHE